MNDDNRYTLTIYVAAPGTPLFKDGKPWMENGEQKTSQPGHVFYGISKDGGHTIDSYGFAPPLDTDKYHWYHPDKPGDVQKGEHKEYLNPVYERTMEITKEQYMALQNFGEYPQNYGFNKEVYNWATNSCIDFTFTALYRSGIYKGKEYIHHYEGVEVGRTINNSYEGTIRVLPNIEEFDKISNQIPNSDLNQTIKRAMPKRTPIQWLISENQHEQQYRYAQTGIDGNILQINDIPKTAQAIFHQCKQAFTDFCDKKNIAYDKNDVDKISMSLTSTCYANNMQDVSLFNINDNGKISVGHRAPGLIMASVDMWEAAKTPVEESLSQIQQTAQQIEYEEQQKQIVQSQSRGMMLS